MYIQVFRVRFKETRTVGQLYIDGDLFCFTLEDKMRQVTNQPIEKWKVHGETAIPTGVYKIVLQYSPHFGPDTISLLGVPGFTGVRVHSGNNETNTEGCLIVGYRLTDDGTIKYGTTKPALLDLKGKIRQAIDSAEEVYMEISNVK